MRIERSLAMRDTAKVRVADAFSVARLIGATHGDLLEMVQKAKPVRAPHWVKSYIDGYQAACTDELYRSHLFFGGWIGEHIYSTDSGRADYYGRVFDSVYWMNNAKRLGHYWMNGKPFFVNEESN